MTPNVGYAGRVGFFFDGLRTVQETGIDMNLGRKFWKLYPNVKLIFSG
jgi:hypothetical protein